MPHNLTCTVCETHYISRRSTSKYCSMRCMGIDRRGKCTCVYPGRYVSRGYVYLYSPHSPMATARGYVAEHRLIASQLLGRPLTSSEIVHHINGNNSDNQAQNLAVMTQSEHFSMHLQGNTRGKIRQWCKRFDCCTSCGRTDRPHSSGGLCNTCYMRFRRQT